MCKSTCKCVCNKSCHFRPLNWRKCYYIESLMVEKVMGCRNVCILIGPLHISYASVTFVLASFYKIRFLKHCCNVAYNFSSFIGLHCPLMHYCSWNEPKSVHLHRQIHCSFISSPWSHENYPCTGTRILIFWERGSQFTSGYWHDHSSHWNGMVWQCFVKTRW